MQLLEDYLHIRGEMPAALSTVEKLFAGAKLEFAEPIAQMEALFRGLSSIAGPVRVQFDAGFGRHFEYYTGLVFQIEVEGAGRAGEIAGGGRYDGLIGALSENRRDVPAVGAAIHTERLLAAIRRS